MLWLCVVVLMVLFRLDVLFFMMMMFYFWGVRVVCIWVGWGLIIEF